MGRNGRATRIGRHAQCRSLGLSPTSSGRSPRRSGRRPGNGREAGPPKRITACQRARSPMAWWPVAPRGSLRGSTNSRRGTAYPGSVSTGRIIGPLAIWWCRYQTQTRDHLFKERPERKRQQKILWAEVKEETGRWKDRWKIRGLLADKRCSRAVLDFLSSTDVGRLVPPLGEGDAGSEAPEWERREQEEEREAEAEELGAAGELGVGGATAVPTHAPLHGIRR